MIVVIGLSSEEAWEGGRCYYHRCLYLPISAMSRGCSEETWKPKKDEGETSRASDGALLGVNTKWRLARSLVATVFRSPEERRGSVDRASVILGRVSCWLLRLGQALRCPKSPDLPNDPSSHGLPFSFDASGSPPWLPPGRGAG